jgi:NAD(P)-dependent dehydrogenase (short-subunit alcohol dehydrogenase family)
MSKIGRHALVIGASSQGGLGEATARRLAADGCRVTVASRSKDALAVLAAELGGASISCDITDEVSIAAMIASAGPIDILVNAAGTTEAGGLARIKRERVDAQMAVHYTANVLLLKHAMGAMQPGSAIILFSSLTAQQAGVGLTTYSCAKAALDQLVRIAALELGPIGIRVNAVAPGFSETPMTKSIFDSPEMRDLYLGNVPLEGRGVTPAEVAAAVAWLADPLCFMSGEIIQMSGGAQLGRLPTASELKQARKQ